MASKGKGQSGPSGDGEGKKSKKKHGLPGFSSRAKDGSEKKPWFSFPFLPKMQDRGRFHVSSIDKRIQTPPKHMSVHMQQTLLAAMNFDDEDSERKVVLGICAMDKKSNSKPMHEIIRRLVDNFERLQVFVFDEDTILNKPVEEWPIVNGFVSFFSHGFPLEKAIAYKNLRNPFIVNNLEMQYTLQSRPKVYAMMKENNIPHPRFAVLDRDADPDCKVVETEDSIEVDGNLFMKPFVEKPVDAEDHNIYIYFPVQAGGGSTRLFRKVKDRSSVYSRFCRVRTQGSYLYEDFMPTDGTDVKVYTVGPDYQHAEARKSPALDGKVERNLDGKEIRYPVLLTSREKMIARTICKVFKQNVCGFDLLRANGRYYVCDINGFSFVKTSSKYYDDCAKILGTLVMRACCPRLHIPYPMCTAPEDIPVVQTTSGSMMELRCVVAVIRHGDRTPKQKMKMEVKNKKFLDLFEKHGGYKTGHLKLKKPKQLQEVLDIVRHLLSKADGKADPEIAEKKAKLNQLKLVLEMYGHFSGINRKVQLKYQPKGRPKRSSSEEDEAPREPSLLLILKWGGELTPAGRAQAENLGKAFRTLYPGGQGQFEAPGLGFLRLHSTFRHDLKIYASDEGRVQMTAAAFTKGMLALEGELTPIVVQMVKSANTNGLLDAESNTSKCQIGVKEKLKDIFNQDQDFTQEDFQKLAATNSISLINAMQFVKNPFQMCMQVHEMIKEFTARIRCLKVELKSRDLTLFNGESWELLIRRWSKLEKDFRLKNGRFDISKIPDIYDCIKYDLHYNQKTLQFKRSHELFMCSKALADIIIPQEYGITKEERLHIGQSYCMPLLRKIRSDLLQCMNSSMDESTTRLDSKYSNGVSSPERFVRTRLYFTSESHIHSLLSILRYGGLLDEEKDEQWKQSVDFIGACAELNYMSQIVLMMFEDPAQSEDSDERFHIELHFSPGAYTSCDEMAAEPKGMGFRPKPNRETVSETTTPTNMHEVLEVCPAQGSSSQRSTPVLRQCISLPDNVQEDLMEGDLFPLTDKDFNIKEIHSKTAAKEKPSSKVRLPSPDPDTPEWDWGDEEEDEDNTIRENIQGGKGILEGEVQKSLSMDEQANIAKCNNYLDNYIKPPPKERPPGSRTPDTEVMQLCLPSCVERALRRQDSNRESASSEGKEFEKDSYSRLSFKKTEPIHIKMTHCEDSPKSGHDDKRSRSLEDTDGAIKMEIDGRKKPTSIPFKLQTLYEHQDDESFSLYFLWGNLFGVRPVWYTSKDLERIKDVFQAYERNYRTIHLPLSNDIATKQPLSSFFFYNQAPRALEGFSNVPLLHPLETLHNNLTFHQVHDFLRRVTRTRFGLPDTNDMSSLASKSKLSLSSLGKGSELPSSSNSSGGPSSPVLLAAPVDLMKTLGMYIGKHRHEADIDVGVAAKDDASIAKDGSSSSQNDHDESQNIDMAAMTGSYRVTMNKTDDPFTPQDSFEECQS